MSSTTTTTSPATSASAESKTYESKTSGLKVGYWAIRGLAAALRMTCEHAGADYTPVNYLATKIDGVLNKDSWFKDPKAKADILAKNPFANLPYVIDGDLCICQTNACFKYLGRKFNLYGKDAGERSKVDQCLCQIMDLRNAMVGTFYNAGPGYDASRDALLSKKAPAHLQKMEDWLAQNKTIYCASDSISVADFHLWELIDQLELYTKSCGKASLLEGKPNLRRLHDNIKSLDTLQNYFQSDLYKLPVNNPHAVWK